MLTKHNHYLGTYSNDRKIASIILYCSSKAFGHFHILFFLVNPVLSKNEINTF